MSQFPRSCRSLYLLVILLLGAPVASGDTVHYTLQDVVLEEGDVLSGTFAWTYTPGDFENGTGVFLVLDVPYTTHDETDLEAVFDMGGSIEITYPGNLHDDGVDITLFLVEPLTPTGGAAVDLARSAYDIGGNGFHVGGFVSGSVEPVLPTDAGETVGDVPGLSAGPNPFNPATVITCLLPRSATVTLDVVDLAGRRVRRLVGNRRLEAGRHAFAWRGRDAHGRSLPAGTYLARLATNGRARAIKLLLVE